MPPVSQAAYHYLQDYLNSLLSPTHPDQALVDVPVALRAELKAFMRGKTESKTKTGGA